MSGLLVFLLALTTLLLNQDGGLATEAKSAWEVKWDKTLEAAKREGNVMAYASSNFDTTLREFQKRHPEIKVVTVLSPGRILGQRILAERRAEKYLADLYIDGVDTGYVLSRAGLLDPIPPALFLLEVMDQSQWWQKKHHYADPQGQYIFVFEGSAQAGGIGYNTRIVNPKEIRSYWDLLAPKWRGKIIAVDPESRGPAGQNMRFFYYSPKLGPVFVKRLFSEMGIVLTSDRRQLLDWLAVGKFAFGLFSTGLDDAKEQGLPVDEFYPEQFKEGGLVDPTLGAVSLLNKAPHPNAAKVLMNWLLSREGQIAFQRQGANPNSMREDISKEEVAPRSRRVKGVNFLMTTRAEWIDMAPIYKLIREARSK
jgi:iron(III) transport system substrate-binding protein